MAHDDNGHQGFDRSYDRIKNLCIYKASRQLKKYIQHCGHCREFTVRRHKPYGSMQPILTPPIPFYCMTMDFILCLPISVKGFDAAMVIADKFTKRIGIIPGKTDWSAEQWGNALMQHLQLTDWGFPSQIISDRDRKFLSAFWKAMFAAVKAELLYSTAYHPQTDGQTERIIATIEVLIRHFFAIYPAENWPDYLPAIHGILNSAPNASTGFSAQELMYGCKLRTPLNIGFNAPEFPNFKIRDDAAEALKFAAIYMKYYYDRRHEERHYTPGDRVYLRLHKGYSIPNTNLSKKLLAQATGPLTVKERIGKLAYRLDLPAHMNIHDVISVAYLEPAPQEEDPFGREYQIDPPPITEDAEGGDYELDAILNKRVTKKGRHRKPVTQYLVRWKGWGSQWNEWYNDDDLPHARELIQEYEDRQQAIPVTNKVNNMVYNKINTPPREQQETPTEKPIKKRGRPKIRNFMAHLLP